MKRALTAASLSLLLCGRAWALEPEFRVDLSLYAGYRDANAVGPLFPLSQTGHVDMLAGADFALEHESFRFTIRPELRGLVSEGIGRPAGDPAAISMAGPVRLVDLEQSLSQDSESQFLVSLENLYLSYNADKFEAYVGRRVVGLGVQRYFTIWNLFSSTGTSAVLAGPDLRFGSDGFGFRYQSDEWAFRYLDVEGKTGADSVRLLEVTWYSPYGEWHFLGGGQWNEVVAGIALNQDIADATVRMETLYVGIQGGSQQRQLLASLGAEYAFDEKWSGLAEVLVQSEGVDSKSKYALSTGSRFRKLRAVAYGLFQARYLINSFWEVSAGTMLNFVDLSQAIIARTQYTLGDNLEIFFDSRVPLGSTGSEFSQQAVTVSPGTPLASTVGFPFQLVGGLKYFF